LFNLGEVVEPGTPEAVADEGRQGAGSPAPRLRRADREQGQFRMIFPERLLPADHEARIVWAYVSGLDLTPLLKKVRAVEGRPGRDQTDPRIMLALWIYATLEGEGSARRLDELCTCHVAYLWLCGGVSLNYHLLADFRSANAEFFERLLTDSVAALRCEGLVSMERVSQDGMRVRASAGAGSFRRQERLEKFQEEARTQVERLQKELEGDPNLSNKRQAAARERAAREHQERVQRALEEVKKMHAAREKREKGSGDKARASTTDPEARRMKMPDGGTRPAYNAQFATDVDSRIIVGADVTNEGVDTNQLAPMVDQIKEQHGQTPKDYLVDGGFAGKDGITYVTRAHGVTVYAPIREEEKKRKAGKDPFAPCKGDSPEVKAWRQRMGTPEAQSLYHLRAATAEWTNAQARNRGLYQVRVRGLAKVRAVVLLYALAHNLMQARALRAKVAAEAAPKVAEAADASMT